MKQLIFITIALFLSSTSLQAASYMVKPDRSKLEWLGQKITGSKHNGTVGLTSGSFTKIKGKFKGTFEIDMTSIKNIDVASPKWNKKLVDHLKSADFFDTSKHPTGKFVITNSKKKSGNNYTLSGVLTIKGISKTINFPASIVTKGNMLTMNAEKIVIDRTKWDVRYNSKKFFDAKKLKDKVIDDNIQMSVKLHAEKPKAEKPKAKKKS